ncbi:hypothetical protein GCM10026987_36250 [Belliella aquatica]|uniref:Lipocalin-like domain-containing protein n=2 Tax=Belliella aquatica TaxID=1323734 RepID=A0ABQ1LYG4_9BACT|nr:hypothetical protein GCM10010993_05890 [Belliella aquatica]
MKIHMQNIKKITRNGMLALIVGFSLISISCERKEVPTLSVERLNEIYLTNSPWRLERVTVDGVNQTNIYRELVLSFTRENYTSTNGRVIWPGSDTWEFVDEEKTVFRRGDGILVTIQSITIDSLVLSLEWESNSIDTGRQLAIAGNHIFEFVK